MTLLLPLWLACVPRADLDDTASSGGADGGGTDGGSTGGGQRTAVLTTASMDFATGSLATVALDGRAVDDGLATVAGDATVFVDQGRVLQLNRYGSDSLRIYEPGAWTAPALEVSVADADGTTNPTAAAVCDGRIFLALYERQHLLVLDPDSGAITGTVDLSAFADADGRSVETGSMVRLGERLYLGLERLDRDAGWIDAGGRVVEVDCATEQVTAWWEAGGNTRVFPWPGQEQVLVGARAFGDQAGGLYVLDPAVGGLELRIDLSGSGATLASIGAAGDRAVFSTLADDLSGYGVHCADLQAGTQQQVEQRPEYLQGVAANDRGEAWISAHWGWTDPDTARPGVLVYDIESCTSTTGDRPLSLSLAPTSIAFY